MFCYHPSLAIVGTIYMINRERRDSSLTNEIETCNLHDTLSANVVKSFPKLAKSESGQIVSEKVKLTYFDVYLSHTM